MAAKAIYKWFVRFALIAMLIVLATLLLFIWAPSSHPGSAAVEIKTESRMTARNAHQAAEAVVHDWAEDAELIRLSATWGPGQSFQNGEGDWSLLYYSPSKASTASISIFDGQARLIAAHGVAKPIEHHDSSTWYIDSETAVDLVRAVGGDDFLRVQPDATVSMSLDLTRGTAWQVRLIDQMSRRVFSAQVNFEDGEVTSIQQSR